MKLTNEYGLDGYAWCADLHLSIQSRDAKNTMREVLNIVKLNGYFMKISIKLENSRVICFKVGEE